MTIASDRARFRVPELLRGLPDPLMSARLVDVVGPGPGAVTCFFTAAEIDAAAAGAMGLVGEVVPHDELDARAEWVLEQIRRTGPLARAAIKRDLNAQLRPGDVSLFMVPGLSAEITEGMGGVRRETSRGMAPSLNRGPDHHRHAGHGRHRRGRRRRRPAPRRSTTRPPQLLRDALHEHSVLFFHDQDLTEDEQLAFASTFGTRRAVPTDQDVRRHRDVSRPSRTPPTARPTPTAGTPTSPG